MNQRTAYYSSLKQCSLPFLQAQQPNNSLYSPIGVDGSTHGSIAGSSGLSPQTAALKDRILREERKSAGGHHKRQPSRETAAAAAAAAGGAGAAGAAGTLPHSHAGDPAALASDIGRLTANIEKGIERNKRRVSTIGGGGEQVDVQQAMDELAQRHHDLVTQGAPKPTQVNANDL
jgi:hypothetical protein